MNSAAKADTKPTGVIILQDGTVFWGNGFGAEGKNIGELCFNTLMSGYQEVLSDPGYAGQIVTFTFPHIGNVGANYEDIESFGPAARGLIVREDVSEPSNWRAIEPFDAWLKKGNIVGISGLDTRAITRKIRDNGAPVALVAYNALGEFDLDTLKEELAAWGGLGAHDFVREVACTQPYEWNETQWALGEGFGLQNTPKYKVVVVDYGVKRSILRSLASVGCAVTVVPPTFSADEILAMQPDGVFLSNGPGDPQVAGAYAVPVVQKLLESHIPIFAVGLGHQLLALALGGRIEKLAQGHYGVNHPVKELETGKVDITTQNHGFCVVPDSLPETVKITHVSLFDGSNEGFVCMDKPVFSMQYFPEVHSNKEGLCSSFGQYMDLIEASKKEAA